MNLVWVGVAGLFCLLFAFEVRAVDPVLVNCVETPEVRDVDEMPSEFGLSNNLFRRTGSSVTAKGEMIYIVGRVTDEHCHPLSNVNVFIWQVNSHGFYQHGSHKKGGDMVGQLKTGEEYDENFVGSGKASTDNLGNFSFITLMPAKYLGRDPRVHFLLKHPSFPDVYTEMFFGKLQHSDDDSLREVPKALRTRLIAHHSISSSGVSIYRFNVTLGKGRTKTVEALTGGLPPGANVPSKEESGS